MPITHWLLYADHRMAPICRSLTGVTLQLGQDVRAGRAILAGKLGPVVIEERDGAVWAQMEVGPALLFAAGADFDSIQGCAGRI